MKLSCTFFLMMSIFVSIAQNTVVINEFVSNNSNGITDGSGAHHDWIELYNFGKKRIDLEGFGISDDPSEPYKYKFSKIKLKSEGHLLLFASNKETNENNEIHLNFKINNYGEPLILTDPNGNRVDFISPIALAKNVSYGRTIDGGPDFERYFAPSPNDENSEVAGIVFSKPQGFYTEKFELNLASKLKQEIRFTLDGSTPNANSQLYTESITIAALESDSSSIGYLETSKIAQIISGNYFKGTVIKAASFNAGKRTSEIYTKSYFISPLGRKRYVNIDIVSLVTDKGNLFDVDSGIYVLGDSADFASGKANFFQRGKAWERIAHVTFFDTLGAVGFEQNIGIRIHGGKGRQNPQKSIRLCADKNYGAPAINYPLFEMREHTVFKTVVLRNSMTCWERSIVKDEVTADVCKNLNVDVLAARPVIVFINGEFWGIHAIREYFDAFYIASNHQVDKKDVNIVLNGYGNLETADKNWGLIDGGGVTHKKMYRYLQTHSLSRAENYGVIQKYLDMGSIIDYYCIEIFFNNRDWPTNNNKLWSVGEGRWRQVLYDMDAGWSRSFDDNVEKLIGDKQVNRPQNRPYARFLIKKLCESPIFLAEFTNRMAYLMNHDFNPKNVAPILAKAKATYKDFIEENDRRWGVTTSYKKWRALFFNLNGFVEGRPKHLEKIFQKNFTISLDSLRKSQ